MQVYLNHVQGVDDALIALMMSKRHWTLNKQAKTQMLVSCATNCRGHRIKNEDLVSNKDVLTEYDKRVAALVKHGAEEITLLKFIDFSFTVDGLHRAGQDDWDAHAERFDNRIIRESTRLATFGENEMSQYYQGKIMPTEMALQILGLELPQDIVTGDGEVFTKADGGYIRSDLANVNDVKRGLYRLSIPSRFIFKVNLAQWAHVYKMRKTGSGANPEVSELAEKIADLIENAQPQFNRDLFERIKN